MVFICAKTEPALWRLRRLYDTIVNVPWVSHHGEKRLRGGAALRRLAAAGFAFALAMAAAHYILPSAWLYVCAACLAVLAAAALFALRGVPRQRFCIIFIFAALALGWYRLYTELYIEPARELAGTSGTVCARVREYSYHDGDYGSVNVRLEQEGLPRINVSVMDYSGTMPELRAGDLVELELGFVDASKRYGEETDVYAARGVQLRAYFTALGGVSRDWRSALYFPGELMRLMCGSIERNFPDGVRGIMLALLVGETGEVYEDVELDNALSITGVAHVISVSGMHLTFLYSSVAQLAGRRRAAFLGAPLVIVFTFMAGCSSAIVRACVMLLLSMAAPILKREYDAPTSLALALLILLVANPVSIASASLQLSFGSMLGLVLIAPKIHSALTARFNRKGSKLRALRRVVIASVSSSLGATVFTAPLIAMLFGYVSLISPVANLLTLWAVSAAFTLGFAAAALGIIIPFCGAVLAWAAAWPARYFVLAIELLARLPFAAVYTADRLIVWWLAFSYAAFAAAYLLGGRGEAGRMRPLVPSVCSAALLAAILIAARLDIEHDRSVTVLDVGQGESVVLLAGESAVVVDCGGTGTWDDAGDTAGEYLLSRGRRSIDALVLTHLHSDHANGAARLLTRIRVGTLYIPAGADDSDGELAAILAAAQRRGTELVEIAAEDEALELGGMSLALLAPEEAGNENESGIAVYASVSDFDTVITGDLGSAAERALVKSGRLGKAELLVAGHHGSRYSNSFELVDAVDPEIVAVSVGYNSYGHPTEDAIFRLTVHGARLYRTDVNGDITVRIDSDG